MTKYNDRTPDSIRKEHLDYTYEGIEDLAKYLDKWMSNEHNARQFVQLYKESKKDGSRPNEIASQLFGHALDWFNYGN
jgi:hypothetical protein